MDHLGYVVHVIYLLVILRHCSISDSLFTEFYYLRHCNISVGLVTGLQGVLAIRRIFSLVDMITKPKFSNCPNVFKIGTFR